jgi:hypothetical protein
MACGVDRLSVLGSSGRPGRDPCFAPVAPGPGGCRRSPSRATAARKASAQRLNCHADGCFGQQLHNLTPRRQGLPGACLRYWACSHRVCQPPNLPNRHAARIAAYYQLSDGTLARSEKDAWLAIWIWLKPCLTAPPVLHPQARCGIDEQERTIVKGAPTSSEQARAVHRPIFIPMTLPRTRCPGRRYNRAGAHRHNPITFGPGAQLS